MYKSILLPIDLSAPASWSQSLPAARHMMGEGGTLHVLTVVPDFGMSVVGSFFEKGFEKKALRQVGEKLAAWVGSNVEEGIDVHPHVTHGRVYEQIINAADKLNVDAIVIAAHTPELADYLLGPNAARVVRHAKQSVFVVRGS
ncbi:universal stress protein [Mesorhizobium sp. Z1-4]|uniref:universal stress protein n=1 Tax=Mesorhizobium sp. Z1-4 TaxID=2448478 RepID=UPI000FDA56BE|nr:universal stress protein [Mesorhizobium sp. Z1-4]